MTKQTFYKWLGRYEEFGFRPYLDAAGQIRLDLFREGRVCSCCPITAVYYMKTNVLYDVCEAYEAAEALGGEALDASDIIVEVADNHMISSPTHEGVRRAFRNRLGLWGN